MGCGADLDAATVAVAREDIPDLANAAAEDGQTRTSLPAAAEIDLESEIILTAKGPAVTGQGKL